MKVHNKQDWTLVVILLSISLIVSIFQIFQLLDKVAELEVVIIEQTKKLAELQGVGG